MPYLCRRMKRKNIGGEKSLGEFYSEPPVQTM